MKPKLSKEEIKEIYHNSEVAKTILQEIFGKEAFEFDPIREIQDFSDVVRLNDMTHKDWVEKVRGLPEDEKAYIALKLIAKAYNQGWKPDWESGNEPKHSSRFYVEYMPSGFPAAFGVPSHGAAVTGAHLGFRKREHAVDAAEKFDEVYREFLIGYY